MSTATADAPAANGTGDPMAAKQAIADAVDLPTAVATVEKAKGETKDEVIEQDDFVDALYLAAISRTHVYACGSGGVGKTFGAEIMSKHFGVRSFYVQFRNDTKREEVFGPLSMRELQNDRYVHVVEGYLPEAVIANLDEFKDAGRFTRQLLNILNERWMVNGATRLTVPLRTAIGTTNFWIEETELEALFDRFAQRIIVEPVKTSRGFKKIMRGGLDRDADELAGKDRTKTYTQVTPAMLVALTEAVLACNVDGSILDAIDALRKEAAKEKLYMSPRRWQEGLKLARAQAVLAGRDHVTDEDLRIYARLLLDHPDNVSLTRDLTKHLRDKMTEVVEEGERALTTVRDILAPVRLCVDEGRVKEAPMDKLSEARSAAMTAIEMLDRGRAAANGGGRHKGADELKASLEAEVAFTADVALGRIK